MSTINKFEDLSIWQQVRELCKDIFLITQREEFLKDYRFKSQIRSSSGSVMDNIAEGFERGGTKEFIQFLYIAKASCGEARSQLHRALDYAYINNDEFELLCNKTIQLSKSIQKFASYLKTQGIKVLNTKKVKILNQTLNLKF